MYVCDCVCVVGEITIVISWQHTRTHARTHYTVIRTNKGEKSFKTSKKGSSRGLSSVNLKHMNTITHTHTTTHPLVHIYLHTSLSVGEEMGMLVNLIDSEGFLFCTGVCVCVYEQE